MVLAAASLAMPAFAAAPAPDVGAGAAILIHAETREPLFELRAGERMLIASTTKIMTALVALERCSLSESVEIDSRSAGKEGSSMYLREGEEYTVEDLLYGLMLASGNDAASALAIHAAGSEAGFVRLMNEKAAELGLEDTSFANPHGLDAEGHYSTARDMAVLAAYAMENDVFARIVSTRSAVVHGAEISNHNRLLSEYPGCIGVKTGYTMAAGRTLVSCAERDGTRFICVTLSDRDDWADHAALYDWAFENFEYRRVIDSQTVFRVPSAGGEEPYVELRPARDGMALLRRTEEAELKLELPPFVFCPVYEGDAAGRIYALTARGEACSVPLVCARDAPAAEKPGLPERLLGFLGRPIYLTGE